MPDLADDTRSPRAASAEPPVLLRVRDVSMTFGGVQALDNVSLELVQGQVHALLGENGAGKSTLIKILSGAQAPDQGLLELDGQTLRAYSPARARALGVAVVYQQPALLPELSVAENVCLADEPPSLWRRVNWPERRARTQALLRRLGLELDPDLPASALSMPEQRLVEIARALGGQARVLILDEPTASLSSTEVETLLQIVRQLRADGLAILYVTHHLDEVFAIADRITVLRDGALVTSRAAREIDARELIRCMVGRELGVPSARVAVAKGDLRLQTRGLGCRAAGVRDVSLSLGAGETLGLFGLVNSGRTELAQTLFGLTPADSGELVLDRRTVTIDSPGAALRHGLAYVPEDRREHGVIGALPVAANCTLALLGRLSRRGLLDRGRERRLAREAVERFGIKTASLESPVDTLSGGNQQKVALARWLATEPRVLILDEPTQGVDVGAKAEIHARIDELRAGGLALLLISSELPEILALSDRIAVMRSGTIVATLARDQATPELLLAHALGTHEAAHAV